MGIDPVSELSQKCSIEKSAILQYIFQALDSSVGRPLDPSRGDPRFKSESWRWEPAGGFSCYLTNPILGLTLGLAII